MHLLMHKDIKKMFSSVNEFFKNWYVKKKLVCNDTRFTHYKYTFPSVEVESI